MFVLGDRCGGPSLAAGMHTMSKGIVSAAPGAAAAQGCGVGSVSFCLLRGGAGQGRQTALQPHCNCGFPNMGLHFRCGLLLLLLFLFFPLLTLKRPNINNCFFFPWFWMEPLVQSPLRDRSQGSCPSHPLSLSCFASAMKFGNSSAPQHALMFNMI